jgi:glycogen synthase
MPAEILEAREHRRATPVKQKMRVALAAWEIGRVSSGLGAKVGGLGVVVEELPRELIKAAARQDIELEIVTLSPCFAYHDKSKFTKRDMRVPVTLDGHTFEFEVYEHVFPDGQKVVYFWDHLQLHWTTPAALYPSDPQLGLRLYATVSQAMAGYIKQGDFDTIHLHDYHVGLIPLYLGDEYLLKVPIHLTIHNASYQGNAPVIGGAHASLERISMPGEPLDYRYFDFLGNVNIMKACMLKVHETGGKITTVSGDLSASWGYVAELKMSEAEILARAAAQKGGRPGEVFLPNRGLDLFEKLPIAGITNGISDQNLPQQLPELKADALKKMQAARGLSSPIFLNPIVQAEMLGRDHAFDADTLPVKSELKRLLHLEAFGTEPAFDPILITAVGRLVEQKNFGIIADIMERTLAHDPGVKFILLASAPREDADGTALEERFGRLSAMYPQRVYFNNKFNQPLSRLILAGGDFTLVPSRFEPCGLVDYEASLLGNIVIGRATGGLTKVAHCGYLYEWLDISDPVGEANAFYAQIKQAIGTYRRNPLRHQELVRTAMKIDASWDASATQYLNMYRYGLMVKRWHAERHELVQAFMASLKADKNVFTDFFVPAREEYRDTLDWELRETLLSDKDSLSMRSPRQCQRG